MSMGNKTTTRADLAEAVMMAVGVSRHEAAELVEQFLEEIAAELVRGRNVKLSSFGSFILREKRERMGRNPKTGEAAKITSRRVLVFKASNILKARTNERVANRKAAE